MYTTHESGMQWKKRNESLILSSSDSQCFGLAVDAFTTRALDVNGLVEQALTVQGDAHMSPKLGIDIFHTSSPFEKLSMSRGAPVG